MQKFDYLCCDACGVADTLYRSQAAGNVYTPGQYPANWEAVPL